MTAQTILPANTLSSGSYQVDNSLRFNSGSSDYLTKAVGTTSNRRTFTYSTWIKRGALSGSAYPRLFNPFVDSNNFFDIYFRNTDALQIYSYSGGSDNIDLVTTKLFRDVSAWYHIVIAVDTTQGTNSNRVKVYVNGSQVTSFSTSTYPGENADLQINLDGVSHVIGRNESGDNNYFDGYMAEVRFIDGSQLAATSFGEFDSDSPNIWKPKSVTGLTSGTNGFYLEFKGSGTSANSSGLGADTSGNDHHFTVNNLTAVDQSTDTCTLNYSTLNFLATSSFNDLSEGGLKVTGNTATNDGETFSTFLMPNTSSKWYWEVKCTNKQAVGNPKLGFIQAKRGFQLRNGGAGYGGGASGTLDIMVRPDGKTLENGSTSGSAVINTWDTDDILMFAIDTINGAFYVGINGTWQTSGDPTSGSSRTGAIKTWDVTDAKADDGQAVCIGSYNGSVTEVNFGSPSFAISSSNTDTDGYGNFEYAVPSGHYALNSKNLAEHG